MRSVIPFAAALLVLPGVFGASIGTPTTVEARDDEMSSITGTTTAAKCGTAFKYSGVNEAGAEFGVAIPGELGTDYTCPSSIDFFMENGMNTFRIAFKVERLVPLSGGLTGPFDRDYFKGLWDIVNYITRKGGYAVLDPHNYIYNDTIIENPKEFTKFWQHLARPFRFNKRVIFDLMNEPHTMDATLVASEMQAAVLGIRAIGARQLILVQGTAWSGAWSWTGWSENAPAFVGFHDPLNNTAIEMHQYLDTDGSGTSDQCVSSTVGAERLVTATEWLKENGFKGFLGEMGVGSNDDCISAITGALCSMQESGVWIGFLYWAAGPWWGQYFQSIEPPSGPSVERVLPAILPYLDLRRRWHE